MMLMEPCLVWNAATVTFISFHFPKEKGFTWTLILRCWWNGTMTARAHVKPYRIAATTQRLFEQATEV
jgi:hypothetical protein